MKNIKKKFISFLIILILAAVNIFAIDVSDISDVFTDLGYIDSSKNEGTTSFRSLLIPVGGRSESLGSAYTGLCDDAGYINYNSAASCIINETQACAFHNSWIADSKMDTVVYTTRIDNVGIGFQATNFAANISYNFLAGYDFKGLALGATIKSAFRSVPDYTDNDTDAIISLSGLIKKNDGVIV